MTLNPGPWIPGLWTQGLWILRFCILALGVPATLSGAAFGQAVTLNNSKIDFVYLPASAKYSATIDALKERRVLEQLSEFVSPLRLPHPFHLTAKECGVENAFYKASE